MAVMTKKVDGKIIVSPIKKERAIVTVQATEESTLISNRLDPKIAEDIVSKETGKAQQKRVRDLDAEYETRFHYTPDGEYGYPAAGFAGAILFGAQACGVAKTDVKRAIRVLGDIYPLEYEKLNKRVDYPRRRSARGMGAPDVRIRPEFVNWKTDIIIEYDASQMGLEQVVNLVNQGGFSGGIGDWRPSAPQSPGTHGMFQVIDVRSIYLEAPKLNISEEEASQMVGGSTSKRKGKKEKAA